jgi:hypothetical protein
MDWVAWIPKDTDPRGLWNGLFEQIQVLHPQFNTLVRPPRDVAARTRQRGDQATPHRICDAPDDDGDCRGGLFGSQSRWRAGGEDHVHLEANKFRREFGQPLILSLGGPDLNGHVLALDPAEIVKPLPECLHEGGARGAGFKISDPRDFPRLLRFSAERCDEEAERADQTRPVHWITSAGLRSTDSDIARLDSSVVVSGVRMNAPP